MFTQCQNAYHKKATVIAYQICRHLKKMSNHSNKEFGDGIFEIQQQKCSRIPKFLESKKKKIA